jgi:hypothetical protein
VVRRVFDRTGAAAREAVRSEPDLHLWATSEFQLGRAVLPAMP